MADAQGNVLHVPGHTVKAQYTPTEILASYARFTQKGVTLAKDQGVLAAGTAIGRVTSTKKYVPYATGASDGSQNIVGFLRREVDTTGEDKLGNVVISGILKRSLLVGLDSGGITALNGRVDSVKDYFIF